MQYVCQKVCHPGTVSRVEINADRQELIAEINLTLIFGAYIVYIETKERRMTHIVYSKSTGLTYGPMPLAQANHFANECNRAKHGMPARYGSRKCIVKEAESN